MCLVLMERCSSDYLDPTRPTSTALTTGREGSRRDGGGRRPGQERRAMEARASRRTPGRAEKVSICFRGFDGAVAGAVRSHLRPLLAATGACMDPGSSPVFATSKTLLAAPPPPDSILLSHRATFTWQRRVKGLVSLESSRPQSHCWLPTEMPSSSSSWWSSSSINGPAWWFAQSQLRSRPCSKTRKKTKKQRNSNSDPGRDASSSESSLPRSGVAVGAASYRVAV
jgi:hypothetical protein